MNETVKGIPFLVNVGATVTGGQQNTQVGAFMTGQLTLNIQQQPATFSLQTLIVDTGVLVSGSMQNAKSISFAPHGVPCTLANLALMIGIDDEGIPSVGFTGQLTIGSIDTALAFFVDSVTPSNSMFAASLSGFTLATLAGGIGIPMTSDTSAVLDEFALMPITAPISPSASVSASAAAATFDSGDPVAISSLFQTGWNITMPASGEASHSTLLVDVNQRGSLWYVTDISNMTHYKAALPTAASPFRSSRRSTAPRRRARSACSHINRVSA